MFLIRKKHQWFGKCCSWGSVVLSFWASCGRASAQLNWEKKAHCHYKLRDWMAAKPVLILNRLFSSRVFRFHPICTLSELPNESWSLLWLFPKHQVFPPHWNMIWTPKMNVSFSWCFSFFSTHSDTYSSMSLPLAFVLPMRKSFQDPRISLVNPLKRINFLWKSPVGSFSGIILDYWRAWTPNTIKISKDGWHSTSNYARP